MVKMFSKKDINENLRAVMNLSLQIDTKNEELKRWRELSQRAAGIYYSHAKSGIRGGSRTEDYIIKIDAIESSIEADVEKLVLLKNKITLIINKINDPVCKSLLSLRYLNCMSWEQVAEFMDYSYVHVVHRLHPKALDKFNILYCEEGGTKNSG